MNESTHISYRIARRIVIAVIGVSLLVVGAALLVLPGPGTVVIVMGLGVLALEFAWARHWLKRLKEAPGELRNRMTGSSKPEDEAADA